MMVLLFALLMQQNVGIFFSPSCYYFPSLSTKLWFNDFGLHIYGTAFSYRQEWAFYSLNLRFLWRGNIYRSGNFSYFAYSGTGGGIHFEQSKEKKFSPSFSLSSGFEIIFKGFLSFDIDAIVYYADAYLFSFPIFCILLSAGVSFYW